MAHYVLSAQRHSALCWQRFTSYAFASGHIFVGLAAGELARAALSLPLVFVEQRGVWSLGALLGLVPGQNLYVGTDGRWNGEYIPATLRAHPFHLGWDSRQATLCVDEGSGLLVAHGTGEPFFDERGDLSAPVREVWTFLSQTAESILALEHAAGFLAETGVLEPWPITVNGIDGPRTLSGLHRIAEGTLNALDGGTFTRLRDAGVLSVAYAQMLSMGNLPQLAQLAQARVQAEAEERARVQAQASTPLIHLPADSTIDWDWSKIGR